ncbi:MAG: hypothetical protein WCW44_00060 [archaeon]|jgi:hypothetical protein
MPHRLHTLPAAVKKENTRTQTRWKIFRPSMIAARESTENYVKFGKRFINNFKHHTLKGEHEFAIDLHRSFRGSPISVSLAFNTLGEEVHTRIAFEARVEFNKNEVFITALQGKPGKARQIKEFEEIVKMPITNYLVLEIEKQAKANGYSRVVFPTPEVMASYKSPNPLGGLNERGKELAAKFSEKGLSDKEKTELNHLLDQARERIRRRIHRTYTYVARDLGYTHQGHIFVKEL